MARNRKDEMKDVNINVEALLGIVHKYLKDKYGEKESFESFLADFDAYLIENFIKKQEVKIKIKEEEEIKKEIEGK